MDISGFNRDPGPRVVTISNTPARPAMTTTAQVPAEAQRTPDPPRLSPEQERAVLAAAARHVAGALVGRPADACTDDPALAGAAELPVGGAYVTLKRKGQLRACTGLLAAPLPLARALRRAAVHTATGDHRLPPISVTELPFLDLDVNLLFGHRAVEEKGRDRLSAVEVGRHGVRIQRGESSGLLLPCVAVEQGWDSEAFLRHLCRKAGLPTTTWEDEEAALYTFESVSLGGPFETATLAAFGPAAAEAPRIDRGALERITAHARGNVAALARGMAPSYVLADVPDGQVAGLALTLSVAGVADPVHFLQLALRPGVPLQATLFGLCEAAARNLATAAVDPRAVRVDLTVLTDPAMHGTVAEPDLRGIDPGRRALLLIESNKTCWAYDPSADPEGLLSCVRERIAVVDPGRAGLYSLEAHSTLERVVFRGAPDPVAPSGGVRPPAQAGRFYPADPSELNRLVDGLLARTERRPAPWPLALVPHAGLRFSGGVAAAVFNRLEVPETVLVIGPKHTPHGVDWAVDPHHAWAIPGATLPSDPELARALADAIPGLRLDAAAHRLEHAVEVELPFLARVAPHARVVGVAIGGGSWENCRAFAEELAAVIRRLPRPPLILVSTDMNHFATDAENRRLDEVALRALERLDPQHLLATVVEHDISMCGVLPAVIALETLRLLGGLGTCERVAYATSADATGDPSRVVGYAGVLLR